MTCFRQLFASLSASRNNVEALAKMHLRLNPELTIPRLKQLYIITASSSLCVTDTSEWASRLIVKGIMIIDVRYKICRITRNGNWTQRDYILTSIFEMILKPAFAYIQSIVRPIVCDRLFIYSCSTKDKKKKIEEKEKRTLEI